MNESVCFIVQYLPLFITILYTIVVIGIIIWAINNEHSDSSIWVIYISIFVLLLAILLILLLSYWLCHNGYLVVAWLLLIIITILLIGYSLSSFV